MTILVTGATGHLGRHIVEGLLREGTEPGQIVAGGRRLDRVADLAERSVRVVPLDYDEPATVVDAMQGVDRVVLVSGSEFGNRVAQHSTVIDAAAAAGVELLAYTSAPNATDTQLVVAPEHKATEEHLVASGVPWVMLRAGWYNENYLPSALQAAQTGVVVSSAGAGRVASAARVDFADAAVAVITGDGHAGRIYELTGDTAWDFAEFAALVGELSGRAVEYRAVSPDEHATILASAGLDEGTAGFVVAMDANIRDGLLGHVNGELSALIGRPTTPLRVTLATLFA